MALAMVASLAPSMTGTAGATVEGRPPSTYPVGFTAEVHMSSEDASGSYLVNLVVAGTRKPMPPASGNCLKYYWGCIFKATGVAGQIVYTENNSGHPYTCTGHIPPFYSRGLEITPVPADEGHLDSYAISLDYVGGEDTVGFGVAFFAKVHLIPPGDGVCTYSYVEVLSDASLSTKYSMGQMTSTKQLVDGTARISWHYGGY